MNWRMVDCIEGLAEEGYVAAMECRRDQVDRPNSSTSGGHSDCAPSEELVAAMVDAPTVVNEEVDFGVGLLALRIIPIHAEEEVQLRQGLPSLSRMTPLGNLR